MAIIRTFRTGLPCAAVIEDPIPGSPYMFFQLDAVNKNTLTPLFDTQINFSTTGSVVGSVTGAWTDDQSVNYNRNIFGSPILSSPPLGSTSTSTGTYRLTGVLLLNGEVTHCRHMLFNTANDYRNTLDFTPMYSMDPTRIPKQASYFSDGTNNVIYFVFHEHYETSAIYNSTNYVVQINTSSQNLVSSNFMTTNDYSGRVAASNSYWQKVYPMYRNPTTGNMVWHGQFSYSTTGAGYPSYHPGLTFGGAFTAQAAGSHASPSTGSNQYYSSQWVGVSSIDGYAITLGNSNQNDYTTQIWKYNDSANTATNLINISTLPTASGSSLGGNRGTNFGGAKNKYCSRWFTDPLTANSRGFYMPYCDSSGNYAPFYWQWNTSTDAFTRNSNCTVNWGGGNNQATFWAHDNTVVANTNATGMQTAWYNETFTVGANRYLLFMQLNGAGGLIDSIPKACTFVCFSVNAADPRLLTYHSRIQVPVTPKNIVWLSDDRTVVGVFTHSAFYIYTFTEANGWTQTANLPFQFSAVGRDNLGRIWAVEPGPYQWGRVHLITLTVPVTIVVTPDATTYTYSGTTINANVAVKALDASGNRISTSVKLVIDGGSMLFGGNNYTTTITTSASADVNVAVTITGGGVSNIIASVPV